ncbi:MAG TPA: DNA polymerase I [Terriglobales bacterium]|nr:DNA polymerase I [Terriglobales bacterium]
MPTKKKSVKVPAETAEAPKPPSSSRAPKPAGDKPPVFLLDSMGFIFRAYHAMSRQRPMSTRTGIPTAATYVFVNMLNKLREDFKPEYLAAVFDLAGPTFRDDQAKTLTSFRKFDSKTQQYEDVAYHGYKATRKETPADLNQQIPYIRRALEAYRIPILSQERFEADDIIGTLARKAADAGHPVYIVSSDKDMLQLVDERVCVLNPPKDNLICDAAKVEEIVGVPPSQVVDVMALRGDTIDNIPGAPGIGEKGSVEIIKRFGTVEAALDHAAEIERKTYRESLQQNRDMVMMSKDLARIDTNMDIPLDLDAMKLQPPDLEACRALFNELEFTTLLKSVLSNAPAEVGETHYTELKTAAEVKALLKQAEGKTLGVAIPVEVASATPALVEDDDEKENEPAAAVSGNLFAPATQAEPEKPPRVIGLSAEFGHAAVVEMKPSLEKELVAALAGPQRKAVHDLKAAHHQAKAAGWTLANFTDDTYLYSYLLDPTTSSHGLKDVAVRHFNLQLAASPAEAADITLRLASKLRKQVEEQELAKLYEEIDLPLVPVLLRMEEAGVKIDTEVLHELSLRLGRDCGSIAKEVHHLAGMEFNINSPKQLGDVLFNKLNLPKPVKYGKGKTISTAVDVLEELAAEHEIARKVLDFRQLSKLKSTYIDALPTLLNAATNRLHTTFNQAGTATGRLSSTNPNLQNIPIRTEQGREIRACFTAEKGHILLAADYSQIELRLLAHYSEDPLLVAAFRRGDDIHSLTAQEVFEVPASDVNAEHRRRAKAVNFGIVYGLSPFGLSQQLGIETKVAKQYIDNYFAKYTGVRTFIDRTLEETRRQGSVRTMFGRLRPIPDIHSSNVNMRGFAERTAVNTPLQGTAADLIKIAMIRIDAELTKRKLRSRMTLQVHDELVFEAPENEVEDLKTLVCDLMENVHPELRVPLVVDVGVGKNWRDMD